MCDLRSYNREFVLEFIELYRSYPCLWKIKSKEYIDRQKKNDAYGVLVKKLQEVEEGATKDTVIKKINTLRGGFCREFKKILASHHSGAGEDEVYVPHLWYYENLLFLKDQDEARPSVSNICQVSLWMNCRKYHLMMSCYQISTNGCMNNTKTSCHYSKRIFNPTPSPRKSVIKIVNKHEESKEIRNKKPNHHSSSRDLEVNTWNLCAGSDRLATRLFAKNFYAYPFRGSNCEGDDDNLQVTIRYFLSEPLEPVDRDGSRDQWNPPPPVDEYSDDLDRYAVGYIGEFLIYKLTLEEFECDICQRNVQRAGDPNPRHHRLMKMLEYDCEEHRRLKYINVNIHWRTFGQIRQYGVRYTNPTCKAFVPFYKFLLIRNFYAYHSRGSNCEGDDDNLQVTIRYFLSEPLEPVDRNGSRDQWNPPPPVDENSDDLDKYAVGYIGEFLVYKLPLWEYKCDICQCNVQHTGNPDPRHHRLREMLEYDSEGHRRLKYINVNVILV
ncbi:hypothetical protein TcasGA2_TC001654 [Tribolium castaneum]|uniref:MADF domain-containing protein n=1 Tax=Tribolium castaneum TaxID=7070 RepID=D6X1M4_TRICA|nr:hypothetical protein TcasGA2_TC001654 [Tribolium castaneum]